MRLPTNDAIAALGASVVNRENMPATIAVSTDTRAIRPSETFLALRGENFDGHRFIAEAVAGGASAVIVDDASALPDGQAGFVVADTLAAYLTLGGLARDRVRGPVIAITGSTGKTTTKTFAVQALEAAGQAVTATPENENNEIGVAKFLLSLEDGDERVAIVEFGARKYRDLEPLVRAARPDIGVLTNIVKPISKSWAATNASPKRSGTLCRRRAARAQPRRRGFARTCGVAREAADLVRRRCGATAGRHARRDRAR